MQSLEKTVILFSMDKEKINVSGWVSSNSRHVFMIGKLECSKKL